MKQGQERCLAVRKDGQRCEARALPGGLRCFRHAPELEERRREAFRRGGKNSANAVRAAREMAPARLEPVFARLEAALDALEAGSVTASHATAVAAVTRAMVSVAMHGEMEERLRKVEEKARKLGVKV